jgi:hypothetical protein
MLVNKHKYIIIGGSTKCATTSVFAYLASHPDIASSKVKESRFFWMDEYPLKNGPYNIVDGIESYEQVFLDKPGASFRLEATPDYLYSKDTALAIKENLADVKLIFIVRKPIERVISWYKFAKQLNLVEADITIEDYIKLQLKYVGNDAPQHLRAVEQGLYGKYLQVYFDIFGSDSICVLDYEQISSTPLVAMQTLSNFLGIDAHFYKDFCFEVLNKSVQVKDAKSYNNYRNFRRSLRRNFKNVIPGFLKEPFQNAFKKVDNIYMERTTLQYDQVVIEPQLYNHLEKYYEVDQKRVNSIIKH